MKTGWRIRMVFLIVGFTIPLLGFVVFRAARLALCRTDDAERVSLPGTDWSVVTQVYRCGVPDGGSMTITAGNSETHEEVILFKVDTETVSQTTLAKSGIIELIPNDVHVTQVASHFGTFSASFLQVPEASIPAH